MSKILYEEIGGLRKGQNFWLAGNTTWPFAKIEIYEDKIIITHLFSRKLEFQKHEINYIEKYRGFLPFSKGIRIDHNKAGMSPFILFWSFSVNRLISKITERGIIIKSSS